MYEQYLCFIVIPSPFSKKHRVNATSVTLLCLTPSFLLYKWKTKIQNQLYLFHSLK